MTSPAEPRRRGTELTLLLFGIGLTIVAYANVGLAHSQQIPSSTIAYGAGLTALFVGAHIAVRRLAPYADPVLLPIAAVLNGLGLVLIRRLDFAAADRAKASHTAIPHGAAPLQLEWTVIGIVLFVVVLVVIRDHRRLEQYTYTAMAVALILLAIPAVLPASHSEVNGARIWIRFGGFSIQPGEIAKLALEVFFAGYLVRKRELLPLPRGAAVGGRPP